MVASTLYDQNGVNPRFRFSAKIVSLSSQNPKSWESFGFPVFSDFPTRAKVKCGVTITIGLFLAIIILKLIFFIIIIKKIHVQASRMSYLKENIWVSFITIITIITIIAMVIIIIMILIRVIILIIMRHRRYMQDAS